jgi:hypothetical protein
MKTTTIPYVKVAPPGVAPVCSTQHMGRIVCGECGRLLCYADRLPASKGIELKCRCKAVTLAWGDDTA